MGFYLFGGSLIVIINLLVCYLFKVKALINLDPSGFKGIAI